MDGIKDGSLSDNATACEVGIYESDGSDDTVFERCGGDGIADIGSGLEDSPYKWVERLDDLCGMSADEIAGNVRFCELARFAEESGVMDIRDVFRVTFFDGLIASERVRTEKETEERVIRELRKSRGRANENALSLRSSAIPFDVSRLTKSERAALADRALKGEKIYF